MTTILVIEDNRTISDGLRRNLEAEHYQVLLAEDGQTGVRVAMECAPDLVVLDLRLPKLHGYDVLRQMRAAKLEQPVLILSASNTEMEKLRGFRAGADDYVTKPFGIQELLARIEALLRRSGAAVAETPNRFVFGAVEVQGAGRRVTREGAEVSLRPMEFDLLMALLRHPNEVLTRQELLTSVWRYHPGVSSRTVDVHVCELRRKLEQDPDKPRYFETVWKAGYRFRP